jgi:alkylated DNA nucleotide flippase Atl1
LTRYNQELDRDPWEVKRGQLARSGLAMNRDLATQGTWGRQQIGDRSIELADRIVEIWPGPAQPGVGASVPAQGSPEQAPVPVAAGGGPAVAVPAAPATAEPLASSPRRKVSAKDLLWSRLPEILAVIPAGRWTSFADISKVLGVAAGEVGQRLSSELVNAHRVLRLHQASPRSDDQKARLVSEGVRFENGKAAGDLRCDEEFLRAALDEGPGRDTEV